MSQPTSTKVLRPSTVLVSLLKRSWQPSPTSVFSISQLLMMAGGLNDPEGQARRFNCKMRRFWHGRLAHR